MLDQHEQLEKTGGGDELPLRAFYCSSVVSYCRPFNSGGTIEIGKIPPIRDEINVAFNESQLEIHKYILHCRNKLLAHSDAQEIDPEPMVMATPQSKKLVMPVVNDAMAPFTREFTEEVRGVYEAAYHWVVQERYDLEAEIEHLLGD